MARSQLAATEVLKTNVHSLANPDEHATSPCFIQPTNGAVHTHFTQINRTLRLRPCERMQAMHACIMHGCKCAASSPVRMLT